MSDLSPHLSLPYILPAQAQKHVTHNEAIRQLDLLTHLSVVSMTETAPPPSPAEAARYVVAAPATGDWAWQEGMVAIHEGGAWWYLVPQAGWRLWDQATETLAAFDGTAWMPVSTPVPEMVATLGIGTQPDALNLFALASEATLLTHTGAGHQLKLNKALSTDNASLLFQTGWSGRTEMGTTGSDDFAIKLSADGSSFETGVSFDATSARGRFPHPLELSSQAAAPAKPLGAVALYAASRAGGVLPAAVTPDARMLLQPHLSEGHLLHWSAGGAEVQAQGAPHSASGGYSLPALAATSRRAATPRWARASAVSIGNAAEDHASLATLWRGTGGGLGGFHMVAHLALDAVAAQGHGFFGLSTVLGPLAAVAGPDDFGGAIGIGFDAASDSNWQMIHGDGTAPAQRTDLGALFPLSTTSGLLTLTLYAAPSAGEIGLHLSDPDTGAEFAATASTDLPAASSFLAPRLHLDNGALSTPVGYSCAGLFAQAFT